MNSTLTAHTSTRNVHSSIVRLIVGFVASSTDRVCIECLNVYDIVGVFSGVTGRGVREHARHVVVHVVTTMTLEGAGVTRRPSVVVRRDSSTTETEEEQLLQLSKLISLEPCF